MGTAEGERIVGSDRDGKEALRGAKKCHIQGSHILTFEEYRQVTKRAQPTGSSKRKHATTASCHAKAGVAAGLEGEERGVCSRKSITASESGRRPFAAASSTSSAFRQSRTCGEGEWGRVSNCGRD